MPTVLRIVGYRFHFYSDQGKEPPHIHVAINDGESKFWLNPIRLAGNKGTHPATIRNIERIVFKHGDFLEAKYYECFSITRGFYSAKWVCLTVGIT